MRFDSCFDDNSETYDKYEDLQRWFIHIKEIVGIVID